MQRIIALIFMLSFTSFVGAAGKLEKITNMKEFGYFTHTYYLHPQPELINSAITFIASSGLASRPNAKAPLLMSFSCLFSKYDSEQKEKWRTKIQDIEGSAKSLLTQSMSQTPSKLLEKMPLSPAKNDMNWACFFATGDIKYLNEIISTLKHLEERKDIKLYLTAASAKWSLSSNVKSHFKVKMAIEAMEIGDAPTMRTIAKDILNKDPQQIRKETVATLKEQKDKGAWK